MYCKKKKKMHSAGVAFWENLPNATLNSGSQPKNFNLKYIAPKWCEKCFYIILNLDDISANIQSGKKPDKQTNIKLYAKTLLSVISSHSECPATIKLLDRHVLEISLIIL